MPDKVDYPQGLTLDDEPAPLRAYNRPQLKHRPTDVAHAIALVLSYPALHV